MTGWQMLGWALIADVVLIILSFGVAFARIVIRNAGPEESTHIFKGKSS